MKHTPGPWTVEEFTKTSSEIKVSVISANKGWANSGMAGKRTVAEVGHWKDRPNPEADALLVAAAPELLEALEEIANPWRTYVWNKDYRKIARAALEKAKGA